MATVKGLELSKQFYIELVKPMLESQFAEITPRIAAGLVGEGSQCFGYDDEISRDHDWGASICLWLTKDDFIKYGEKLQLALNNLPREFHGYPVNWIAGRNGVLEVGAFYRKYLAIEIAPSTIGQWLQIPEEYLAVASNGEMFADPLGDFSAVRAELLRGYPEDIRKKKLAAQCMLIAQTGQYNYPRVLARNDVVAASLTESEFVKAVISVVYLLNNQYMPFYKWMYHGVKQLPRLGNEIGELLLQLIIFSESGMNKTDYYKHKIELIQEICEIIIEELKRQKLSDSTDVFLVEHGLQVHSRIVHQGLRSTDPWSIK